jgi:hypothetical protein
LPWESLKTGNAALIITMKLVKINNEESCALDEELILYLDVADDLLAARYQCDGLLIYLLLGYEHMLFDQVYLAAADDSALAEGVYL